jgi:hypothetical protein
MQLLNFSKRVATRLDGLHHGSQTLKDRLNLSWRLLIIGAVANSYQYFTPSFLEEAERCSPFRFSFLRARRKRLTSRHGLYTILRDAFLEAADGDDSEFPLPNGRKVSGSELASRNSNLYDQTLPP